MEIIFLILLLSLSFSLVFIEDTLNLILISSAASICICILYLILSAPDVAMTEGAIGAAISTVLLIKAYNICGDKLEPEYSPKFLSIVMVAIFFIILAYITQILPEYGTNNIRGVAKYYIENTKTDIGINSIVAATLASYRGFDTLGETLVIISAAICIMLISTNSRKTPQELKNPVIELNFKILFPISLIFAFYLQIHGEISPGGGFQAGAIAGSIFVFYYMLKGNIPEQRILKNISLTGFLIYFCTGMIGALGGTKFLDYKLLGENVGIFLIEVGVAIGVAATLILLFALFETEEKNV